MDRPPTSASRSHTPDEERSVDAIADRVEVSMEDPPTVQGYAEDVAPLNEAGGDSEVLWTLTSPDGKVYDICAAPPWYKWPD